MVESSVKTKEPGSGIIKWENKVTGLIQIWKQIFIKQMTC